MLLPIKLKGDLKWQQWKGLNNSWSKSLILQRRKSEAYSAGMAEDRWWISGKARADSFCLMTLLSRS